MMLTICISPYDQQIITADGLSMNVKAVFAVTSGGIKVLQEFEADSTLDDVEIILIRRFSRIKRVQMSPKMKLTIVNFMRNYHAKQRMSFDCYAFVNLVNGVSEHEVPFMQKYWKTRKLTWWPRVGSVIFLLSGVDYFHHAAIYIGSGLYMSVYGAGGDIEVATLKSMKKDFGAQRVVLAIPRAG